MQLSVAGQIFCRTHDEPEAQRAELRWGELVDFNRSQREKRLNEVCSLSSRIAGRHLSILSSVGNQCDRSRFVEGGACATGGNAQEKSANKS